MTNLTEPQSPLVTPKEGAELLNVKVTNFHQIARRNPKWLPKVSLGHKTVRYYRTDIFRFIEFRCGRLTKRQAPKRRRGDIIGTPRARKGGAV